MLVACGTPGTSAQRIVPTVSDAFVAQRWGVDDGLPVDFVTDVAREPGGYLWLSTSDGLVRFDGRSFTTFGADPGDGLDTRRQQEVHVAADGAVLARYGTTIAHRTGGRFESVVAQGTPFEPSRMFQSLVTTGGTTYALSQSGVWRWSGERFRRVHADVVRGPVRGVLRTRDGALWAATDRGGVRIDPTGRARTLAAPEATTASLSNPLVQDRAGSIGLATNAGPYRAAGGRFARVDGLRPTPTPTRAQARTSSSGATELSLDTSRLAAGVYVVRVEGESFAETRRLTVVG